MTKEQIIERISDLEDSISCNESIIEDAQDEIKADEEEKEELEEKLEKMGYDEENYSSDLIRENLYMYICTNHPLYLHFIKDELDGDKLGEENQIIVDVHKIPLDLA